MPSDVYTTEDLILGKLANMSPPVRLAVVGDPVAHSRSPGFHNAALRAAGIDAQYVKIHVPSEDLADTLRLLPLQGFIGTNVTIPHKAGALAAVSEADDYARRSGAVNTVVVDGAKLRGFNTDGPGLSRAVREEFGADLKDMRVLLFGAGGGAGRAIAVQCAMEGCPRLTLVNRTVEKAQALAQELGGNVAAIPQAEDALRRELAETDLIINASSVGMKADDPRLVSAGLLTSGMMVYDTIYSGGKTPLVADVEAAGGKGANGLSMLLHQGALSFEIWFDRPAPLEVMRQALLR